MQTIFQDLRFGLRMLGRNFGFSALGVVTLALGIGANIIIFSFFNAFYLRPFPLKEPSRVVDLNETAPRWNLEYTGLSYCSFHYWREYSRSFASLGAWAPTSFNVSFGGEAERIRGARVTHDLATVLGLHPVQGRLFTADDDRPGANRVALLTDKLWRRGFGGANVVGQTLRLNQEVYTIIGVVPSDTVLLDKAELWVPLAETLASSTGWYLSGVGRLKPGVSLAQAREELQRLHASLVQEKKSNENTFPRLTTLSERFFGPSRLVLNVFLGAAALVLLVACANIGALMLARGLARSREFAVRLSLGASPWRIAQLISSEALLLSGFGGLVGLGLGYWGLTAILASTRDLIPGWVRFDLDWRMGLFATVMVLVSGCLGAAPTIRSVLRSSLQESLQASGRQLTVSGAKRRSLNALVVGEMAVTVILMIQASLLLQAFHALQQADPGYRAEQLLLYEISLAGPAYDTNEKQTAFFKEHLEQVRRLPGERGQRPASGRPLGLLLPCGRRAARRAERARPGGAAARGVSRLFRNHGHQAVERTRLYRPGRDQPGFAGRSGQ